VTRRAVLLLASVLIAPACAADPPAAAPPAAEAPLAGNAESRLFPPLDLGLFEGPDRDQWQKPDLIMDAMNIADGSVVAEVGAGGGWFTIRLARRVGPNGHVYAEDIQPEMIEAIRRRLQRENLTNVTPILGTASDPRLPSRLDAVLIAIVYQEMEDPVALLRNLTQLIKPQGSIGVVDFLPGDGGPGPAAAERAAAEAIIEGAAAADLALDKEETIPPFTFLLVFKRAAAPPR
jgi:SAM-dependent methyltransferase